MDILESKTFDILSAELENTIKLSLTLFCICNLFLKIHYFVFKFDASEHSSESQMHTQWDR